MPIKDIGEVLPTPEKLEGEQTSKDDLKDKVMNILNFVPLPSSYAGSDTYVIVQAEVGNKKVTFTGGMVLSKKLESIGRDNLPIRCKLALVKSKKGRGSQVVFAS
jgi:hypothetical protein